MTPAREFDPTITTASNAHKRLGMVRMIFKTIRVGHSIHGGDTLRAAPRERNMEMKIAQKVETMAIRKVSTKPSSVRSRMLQSGGKNWEAKRERFPQ